MSKINNQHLGSKFDDFLNKEDILFEISSLSHKKILAIQIEAAMEKLHINKTEMAEKMNTSRSAVNRLLNPHNTNVTLDTLDRAASALGMDLRISLS